MSEKELLELCEVSKPQKGVYWTAKVYGIGRYLRKFAYYPSFLPLNVYCSHGMTLNDEPAPHELNNSAPVMLYFSPRLTKKYKKKSSKKCETILSPNVFYRRNNKIRQDENSKGTIAFPCHSTPDIDDLTDYNEYCSNLKSLPEKFHPVAVCLHYHDINKGLHKVFMDEGLEVFTAGNPFHPNFIERFYNIIKRFKYTTSNEIGSYAYYAVEMNIPFLLYGNESQFFNIGDENIEKGLYNSFKQTGQFAKAHEIFSIFVEPVTPLQKEFVENELGVYNSISRTRASIIFFQSYLKHAMRTAKKKLLNVLRLPIRASRLISSSFKFYKRFKVLGISFLDTLALNRNKKGKINLNLNKLEYTNNFWFKHSLQEIYLDQTYFFTCDKRDPLIIDCGSNIGLSVIYFKQLFPMARIIAFEPDPHIFTIMKKNLEPYHFDGVTLFNKGVWKENGKSFFRQDGAVGGKINVNDINSCHNINVELTRLADFLSQEIDFLKIDIEGAEYEVLLDCSDLLSNVHNLFVEYHSLPDEPQNIDLILAILKENGFRIYIKEAWPNKKLPYIEKSGPLYDLQLNIFASKNNF